MIQLNKKARHYNGGAKKGDKKVKCKIERIEEKLRNGETIYGTHSAMGGAVTTEIYGTVGFDALWIDMEHGCIDKKDLLTAIIGAAGSDMVTFVRVPWNDMVQVKPILEMGCDGIIFPMITTAEEARYAVASCAYPPEGVRGFGPCRCIQYGKIDAQDYIHNYSKKIWKIVQMGGFLPGVVMLLVLCGSIAYLANKRGYPTHPKASWKERLVAFKRAFLSLMMPVIVMGGLWTGWFTPTEASLISILYVIGVVSLYRELTFKKVMDVLVDTARNFVPALACVSASALFGWILQFERLDKMMLTFFTETINSEIILILCLNLLLLFFGMILDATPVIMLMVPLLMPLAESIGMHPVHMGVMIVLNLMIGLMTPPIGQSLFVMGATMHLPFEYVVKNTYKWLLPLIICLLVVSFVPPVVTFLPRLFGMI